VARVDIELFDVQTIVASHSIALAMLTTLFHEDILAALKLDEDYYEKRIRNVLICDMEEISRASQSGHAQLFVQ